MQYITDLNLPVYIWGLSLLWHTICPQCVQVCSNSAHRLHTEVGDSCYDAIYWLKHFCTVHVVPCFFYINSLSFAVQLHILPSSQSSVGVVLNRADRQPDNLLVNTTEEDTEQQGMCRSDFRKYS